jgi:hypothetical protein
VTFTALGGLASASATTWQELAARVSFPLYQPTVTLGFKVTLQGPIPCGFGGIETIGARYDKGSGKKAPVIGFGEAYPQICGNAGESTAVGSVDVHGVKVLLSVFCRSPGPKCTVKDGFTHGFLLYLHQPGPKRTWIQIDSSHVSLDDLLKVVRSLTRVVPTRPAGPAGAAGCSKATALQLAKRFNLGDLALRDPVAQVLCGSFTGPGSKAMVASFRQGTCLPIQSWAVFRFTGGAWQLVMTRAAAATLAAVGSDIRETTPVFRKGDRPCFPSGGTRARIWHWNGTRFITVGAQAPSSGPVTGTPGGTVLVNGKPYTGGPIAFGSTVDVTKGKVALKASVGTLTVSGGGGITAQFVLLSFKVAGKPLVELRLSGGNFGVCTKAFRTSSGLTAKKPPPKTVRRIFTKGKGVFRTRGNYASTTVRGTDWLTADRCDGTFEHTLQGTVAVFDFRLKKTILVKAGQSYLAKSTSTATPHSLAFTTYARQVDRLLNESAAARKRLQTLAADGSSGVLAREQKASAGLRAVIAVRRKELATVNTWAVPAVARQANALLASALEASLTADQHYLDWVGAEIAGNAGTAKTALAAAQAQDVRATSFKRRFLSVYNRLRTAAGLAPLPPNFAF